MTHYLTFTRDDDGRGWLCISTAENHYDRPERITTYWPIGRCSESMAIDLHGPFPRLVAEEGDSTYRAMDGPPPGQRFHLLDGGQTKPIKTETQEVPKPCCRVETRWHNGRWEKLTKRRGWVVA